MNLPLDITKNLHTHRMTHFHGFLHGGFFMGPIHFELPPNLWYAIA
jgi:hypothetical protein